MKNSVCVLAVVSTLCASISNAAAASCEGIPVDQFGDGNVVYFSKANGGWEKVRSISSLSNFSKRPQKFVYIVKGEPKQTGIIVIKSGVTPTLSGQSDSASLPDDNNVRLARDYVSGAEGSKHCLVPDSPAINAKVPSATYDNYHNYGDAKGKGIELIRRFHIKYVNRNGYCDSTDNYHGLSLFSNYGSNRSQFSFDKHVVSSGLFAMLSPSTLFPQLRADTSLVGREVSMQPYRISSGSNFECVPFYLKVRQGSFVRILDLEGRSGGLRPNEIEK